LLIVCSDHENETVRRQIDVNDELVKTGFKAGPSSRDLTAASQGTASLIYFSPSSARKVADVAALLTCAEHSSVVTVLRTTSLAHAQIVSPEAALALVLRANPGSAINPLFEAGLYGAPSSAAD
jgi:Na+/phosphate symporter